LREDEFEGRIEADIAVDDVVAPVDDEERGNRVDAIGVASAADLAGKRRRAFVTPP
jgi:hypothetical protein